jgi:uncharacterized protein (UPF0212 family)
MTREECIKVLQALWRYKDCGYSENEIRESLDMAIKALEQEPRKGHWIKETMPIPLSDGGKECVRCSECNLHYDVESVYCPNCGAEMEVEE